MNPKIALLLLGAVLLIVSQLMGEGSTIASLAASDNDELQAGMERGEAALNEAISPEIRRTTRKGSAEYSQSLDDFYGGGASDGPSTGTPDESVDEQPTTPQKTPSRNTVQIRPFRDDALTAGDASIAAKGDPGNVPFDPRAQAGF